MFGGRLLHSTRVAMLIAASCLSANLSLAVEAENPMVGAVPNPASLANADGSETERRAAAALLVKKVRDRFAELVAQKPVNFAAVSREKAAAVCILWLPYLEVDYWGAAWQFDSEMVAKEHALRNCNVEVSGNKSSNCQCEMLYVGDDAVIAPPLGAIDAQIARWRNGPAIPALCIGDIARVPWTQDSQPPVCPSYDPDALARMRFVINDVEARQKSSTPVPSDVKVYPPAPIADRATVIERQVRDVSTGLPVREVYFGRVERDNLRLPREWTYHFTIHRVPDSEKQAIAARLIPMERSVMYDVFDAEHLHAIDRSAIAESDRFAHYTRAYDLVLDPAFHNYWLDTEWARLHLESLKKLWVECVIPIDDTGIPTADPLRGVLPIAIETDAALYLVAEDVRPSSGAMGGDILAYDGEIFDLSGCIGDCLTQVTKTLTTELGKELVGPPFNAKRSSARLAPNQMRFERRFAESGVLKGFAGPYYELTTYTLLFWSEAKAGRSRGGQYGTSDNDHVYLQTNISLQVGVGKRDNYPEPTPQQYEAYQLALQKAIGNAVTRTTTIYGGTIESGVGRIKAVSRAVN